MEKPFANAPGLARSVRRKLEAVYACRLSYKRHDLQGDIRSYAEALTRRTEELARVEEAVAQEVALMAEVMTKLQAARIRFTNPYTTRVEIQTTKKGLLRVYKAIGRLDGSRVSKSIHDAGKGLVEVTLPSAVYPNVSVSYVYRLGKADKCRIETVHETRTRLVCTRG
jgi:hypothetical protein